MSLVGALHADQPHRWRAMTALAAGMAENGDSPLVGPWCSTWNNADFIAVWGRNPIIPPDLRDKPVLYLEAGYINGDGPEYVENRLRFISTEWNALGGLADKPPGRIDAKRWDALGITLRPWREGGNRMLVLEQHPHDAAAAGAAYPSIHADLRAAGWTVTTRAHPLVNPKQPALAAQLAEADACLTYSSTAAVEAVCAGIPTVTLSKQAVAWPVTSHGVTDQLYRGARKMWANRLAYRQWTLAELESGEAWERLRKRVL